ncbi:spore germination protein [Orenia marismortui]|uniref:Spore germination protein KA n=1 Tax=Orenia marismortui TaxID=46469 RepID=A0A4R8GQE8_9FIRM|nr:spore germination protein [Orenia marismortui]TDX48036.1 spore germination protein KA [Orenia marismortui]
MGFLKRLFSSEDNSQGKTKDKLSNNLDKNLDKLKKSFSYPNNQDFKVRELYLENIEKKVVLILLKGMVDNDTIEQHIIHPLLEDIPIRKSKEVDLVEEIITSKNATKLNYLGQVIDDILMGNTIILVEGYKQAISIATTKFSHRSVEKPTRESVLKGPNESFIESGDVNTSLIRKRLRDENLISEKIMVGKRSLSKVSMFYIKDIANPDLVERVRNRVKQIQSDGVLDVATLEQHIEERSYSLVPSVLYTQRPDRAVAFLQEGHIVLLMDSSPNCLIVPVTFWGLFHTSEDNYERWPYGNFIRLIRLVAFFITLLTPAVYIAVTNFHIEMIPTDLLFAIAATRERVPFPSVIEVLFMEVAFELLREAGIRIPTTIGPTIGIVGALILGNAAVEANLISPILVIVVALTGLASFTISDDSLNNMVRIMKFIFLGFSSLYGALGIVVVFICFLAYISYFKSFGTPFLAPMVPYYKSSNDLILRPPIWKQWLRPFYTDPEDDIRKKEPEEEIQ